MPTEKSIPVRDKQGNIVGYRKDSGFEENEESPGDAYLRKKRESKEREPYAGDFAIEAKKLDDEDAASRKRFGLPPRPPKPKPSPVARMTLGDMVRG